jgi:trigger factor
MLHSLSHQGITREVYLQISGKSEDEVLEEARPDAQKALRREAVIAAVIEAEDIEPSEGDVLDALQTTALQQRTTPEKLRRRLEKGGRLEELRDDLAQRRAVDLLAESAKPITPRAPEERGSEAEARSKLWTPGS